MSWTNVQAGIPQGSILISLLSLIHITDNLSSNAKLFTNDISIFSVVYDVDTSAKELNDNLKKKGMGFPMKNKFQCWIKGYLH